MCEPNTRSAESWVGTKPGILGPRVTGISRRMVVTPTKRDAMELDKNKPLAWGLGREPQSARGLGGIQKRWQEQG